MSSVSKKSVTAATTASTKTTTTTTAITQRSTTTTTTKAATTLLASGSQSSSLKDRIRVAAVVPAATPAMKKNISVTVESVSSEFVVLGGLDLHQVASRLFNTEFKGGGSIVEIRLKEPRILFRVFAKGKVVSMGAASEDEAMKGCRIIGRMLQKRLDGGASMKFRKYKINNIMSLYKTGGGIILERFYEHHRKEFSPTDLEYFSDLHNHVKLNFTTKFGIQAKLQIWASGNVKFHTHSVADLKAALEALLPLLNPFKTDATTAFLARRKASLGLSSLSAKMAEMSSSSSSDEDLGGDPDSKENRARAAKRQRRAFKKKHLDQLWSKWARHGKHAFLGTDDDDSDDDADVSREKMNKDGPRQNEKKDEKRESSYVPLNSSDED